MKQETFEKRFEDYLTSQTIKTKTRHSELGDIPLPKLNYCTDRDGNEFLAIITNKESEEKYLNHPELELVDSKPLQGDFSKWPVDTMFQIDMFV